VCPHCAGELRPWGHARVRVVRLASGEEQVRPPRARRRAMILRLAANRPTSDAKLTSPTVAPLTCDLLRDLVRNACGFDPGQVRADSYLDDITRGRLGGWLTICAIEARFGIEFPADLVSSMETVDDLLYYTEIKVSQVVER
jgi:hypothetical protein